MFGAILGDIIGQPYEFNRSPKTKNFPLFSKNPKFTDDTVMTIAICDGILKAGLDADENIMKSSMAKSMHLWGRRYQHAGYGMKFYLWLARDDAKLKKIEEEGYDEFLFAYYYSNNDKKFFMYLKRLATRYPNSQYVKILRRVYRLGHRRFHKSKYGLWKKMDKSTNRAKHKDF